MKKSKKLLALGLAAAMAVSLCACGKKGDETPSQGTSGQTTQKDSEQTSGGGETAKSEYKAGETFWSDEPLTFSVLYSDHENYPYQEDWPLWEEITKRTNVTLDLVIVPRTDYDQKRDIMIASGEAPLVIPKVYPGSETKFVPSGVLLPVSEYTDQYMPNFTQKVNDWDMKKDLNAIIKSDGKFYVLPGLHEAGGGSYSYLIRKDIFDKAGITIDEATYNYDQFYQDMKKLKELYPDQYIFSDRFKGDSTLNIAAKQFGVSAGWGKSNTKFDWEKDEFFFAPGSDQYREFLRYFSRLIEEGIMDPESFSQTDDQAVSKFSTGKSFVMNVNPQIAVDLNATLDGTLGKGQYETYIITQPGGPAGQLQSNSTRLENGVCISENAKDLGEEKFGQLLNFVDWLWYSDEGQELTKWGIEGVTYTKVDGKRILDPDIYQNGINADTATKKLNVDFGFSGGVFSYGGNNDLKTSMYTDFEMDYYYRTVDLRTPSPDDPPIMANEEEAEANNLISTPLTDYVSQMTQKFILGELDINSDKEWQTYLDTCKGMGSDTLLENVNKIYQNTKGLLTTE